MPGLHANEWRAGFRPERQVRQIVEAEMQARSALGAIGETCSRALGEDHRIFLEIAMLQHQAPVGEWRRQKLRLPQTAVDARQFRLSTIVELNEVLASLGA